MLDAIRSEWWAPSDQNAWTASLGIRTYGRHLAAALQQRTSATDLADITRHFGPIDIGQILASITRGLLRAAALEARLISRPVREPAAPATLRVRPETS
jgi:hypothetical protein